MCCFVVVVVVVVVFVFVYFVNCFGQNLGSDISEITVVVDV